MRFVLYQVLWAFWAFLGLWAFGALFANVTQGICLSTYLKIALFERTITQCSDSLNGGGGGGVSARLSGTCQRPLQPNKVQMTPILLTCLLKTFSLTQSPQYATQPVSKPLCLVLTNGGCFGLW